LDYVLREQRRRSHGQYLLLALAVVASAWCDVYLRLPHYSLFVTPGDEGGYFPSMTAFAALDRYLFQRLAIAGKAPKVVYDIGASNGWWSAIVSRDLPRAEHHLFEPLSAEVGYEPQLKKHLLANPEWRLHPIALSHQNGTVEMSVDEKMFGSTILPLPRSVPRFPVRVNVTSWRLDDYGATENLPPPDLVKIDTQASEHLILAGGRKTIAAAQVLMIETWLYRGYGPDTPLLGEIVEIVSAMDFALFEFGDYYRDPRGKLQAIDAVFLKPELAILMAEATQPISA
jgi:FkbM family methyltransferase